ncbi:serine/threonine protein kinase [Streptomyces goshikiensis]|uniref:Serine/threonine protein kinase n=1 Tax=Streptomyces goshikiensis TaxID=1942 RepID=A0ABZ1RV38_9ACTN|nr:serine/threonine-protein kinase [Streptomyces goshikiensis]WSY01608.1 serine/threonine protein kinase [Streptomyces goshikiensis]
MESLQPGDLPEIGGYRLLARLGAGGMGEVFLARTASGRPLALKTVHRDLSLEPGFAERFAREIRTNDRVRSPWTVSVVDFSPPGAAPQWLATEYVAAPSLGDWVRAYGPLAEPAVRCLAQELTAALVAVRAAGVVHRDIKPANVLLGPQRPFLIDFGIARAVRDPRSTRTGAVIGTPGYLAPEQATGSVAEAPADVFALASVLVYAATGHGPFQEHGEELGLPALLYRIVHDEPLLGGVPEALVPLVRECLAKDPRQRPTAEALRERLGAAGEEEWSGSLPAALVEDVARRETELGRLLSGSQPPVSGVAAAAAAGTGVPPRPSAAPLSAAAPAYPPTAPGTPPPSPAVTAGPSGPRSSRRGRVLGAVAGVAALAAGAAPRPVLRGRRRGRGPRHREVTAGVVRTVTVGFGGTVGRGVLPDRVTARVLGRHLVRRRTRYPGRERHHPGADGRVHRHGHPARRRRGRARGQTGQRCARGVQRAEPGVHRSPGAQAGQREHRGPRGGDQPPDRHRRRLRLPAGQPVRGDHGGSRPADPRIGGGPVGRRAVGPEPTPLSRRS